MCTLETLSKASLEWNPKHTNRKIKQQQNTTTKMASVAVATHLSAFLFLFPSGVTRLLRSSSLYLRNPSLYQSKTWYFSEPRWKNLDFYALLISLPLSSFSEIFIFLTLPSDHPSDHRFAFAHQSFVLFLFWALLLFIVLRENVDFFHVNEGLVFLFAAISFLSEFSILGRNGVTGVSGTGYELLSFLSLVCAFCCLFLSVRPSSFFAEFLLSSGMVFKGTWVLQIGLLLYGDAFGFRGCGRVENVDVVKCDVEEDGFRAVALMRLSFVGHAVLALVLGFVSFGFLSSEQKLGFDEAGGSLLAQLDSETIRHELEME